jgi:hypothetical protein
VNGAGKFRWQEHENLAAFLLFLLLVAIVVFFRGRPAPFLYQGF